MVMACDTARTSEAFHIERSKLLDAFAAIEASVMTLLLRSGTRTNGEMLGQKIEMLRAAKAAPLYSKACKARVAELLLELEQLLDVRNDVAHSKLRIASLDGELFAIFMNARERLAMAPKARLMNIDQLAATRKKAAKLAENLAEPQPAAKPPLQPQSKP